MRWLITNIAAVMLIGAAGASAQIANPIADPIIKGNVRIELQPIATSLAAPDLLLSAPDSSGRLFIVDQTGQVKIHKNGAVQSTPFLDASSLLVTLNTGYDERGLLGMAFHPDFATPAAPGFGKLYTYTSEPRAVVGDFTVPISGSFNNQSVVREWIVSQNNPDVVSGSSRVLMRIDHPQSNHNAGMIAFGPDKKLYIAEGDGGGSNDVAAGHTVGLGNGQDTSNVLGKILRIDVNGNSSTNGQYAVPADNPFVSGGGVAEIYAYGFRNPYRFNFAPNGDLLAGDVGQNNIEEIDRVIKGGNYGWNDKEGTFLFDGAGNVTANSPGAPAGLIDPILQYDHDEGIAVVGGFVYRGSLIPELQGKYVFGDFARTFSPAGDPAKFGRLFYADLSTGLINELMMGPNDLPLGLFVKGFGEDANGELYVLASTALGPAGTTGVVLAIIPEPATPMLMAITSAMLSCRRRVGQRLGLR